jgi:AraC family transcriptional regulator
MPFVSRDQQYPETNSLGFIQSSLALSNLVSDDLSDNAYLSIPRYNDAKVVQRKSRSWSNGALLLDDVRGDGRADVALYADAPSLFAILDEVGGRLTVSGTESGENALGVPIRDSVNILPAGSSFRAYGDPIKFFRSLSIGFDPQHFDRIAAENGNPDLSFEPKLTVSDQRVRGLCKLLADECKTDDSGGAFYAESLINALMVAVARLAAACRRPMAKGGLASWQLRRAEAYMADNVTQAMSLTEIADLVDFSPSHFCRAFKKSTGKSPYQWMIEARIDLAKANLLKRDRSISEISLQLGFCDQSHFTRTFTKVAGISPLAWQRAHNA